MKGEAENQAAQIARLETELQASRTETEAKSAKLAETLVSTSLLCYI